MKNSFIGSVIVLSTISLTASAEEFSWGNVTFQPRVYAGYADFSLKASEFANFTYEDPERGSITERGGWVLARPDVHKLQISGPLFGIGVTVAVERFFGDFYYSAPI